MTRYKIPCSWQMYGYFEVEADSLEDAVFLAEEGSLPDGDYVEGSFEVDHSMLEDEESKPPTQEGNTHGRE